MRFVVMVVIVLLICIYLLMGILPPLHQLRFSSR